MQFEINSSNSELADRLDDDFLTDDAKKDITKEYLQKNKAIKDRYGA